MANHELKIRMRGNENAPGQGKKGVVIPGRCNASTSDTITWDAEASDVVLFFPDRQLFGARDLEIARGDSATLTVSDNVRRGRYPYAIYCAEAEDFAEGESSPIIIIR